MGFIEMENFSCAGRAADFLGQSDEVSGVVDQLIAVATSKCTSTNSAQKRDARHVSHRHEKEEYIMIIIIIRNECIVFHSYIYSYIGKSK